MHPISCARRISAGVTLVLLAALVPAQSCQPAWLPLGGAPGTDGTVRALVSWDPDGGGPAPRLLVAGGEFSRAGAVTAAAIATCNVATGLWSPLGSGTNGAVRCLAVLADGTLVAGGSFTSAGGAAANRIARWNGAAWSSLGAGMDGDVLGLLALPNGDLVACGDFTAAGGLPAARIARWNGATWSPLGSGLSGLATSLAALQNGDVVAGGSFLTAGGVAASRIARWNGSTWSAMGAGMDDTVHCLARRANGDLVAGGAFTSAGTAASRLAVWNGAAWAPLGSGITNGPAGTTGVHTLTSLPNGNLLVGGKFSEAGFVPAVNLAEWTGSSWLSRWMGGGADPTVLASCATVGNDTATGGTFRQNVVHWQNGAQWPLFAGIAGVPAAVVRGPSDQLYAAGQLAIPGNPVVHQVVRWNGVSWSPLGTGMNGQIYALLVLPNGDLIAGGDFTTAGGVAANMVARWNGSSWSAAGWGIFLSVSALAVLPNGELLAGGSSLYRLVGTTWQTVGSVNGQIANLAVRANGEVIVAGTSYQPGFNIAASIGRWSGGALTMTTVGAIGTWIGALSLLPDGDVAVAGHFDSLAGVAAKNVARWNGTTFTALGGGLGSTPSDSVLALTTLADGQIVAGGEFALVPGGPTRHLARWSGSAWSAIDPGPAGAVMAMQRMSDASLVIVGVFEQLAGAHTSGAARWAPTCPPSVTAYGAGCVGSGGLNTLTASSGPWLGAPFRATGTGMPALGIVGAVYGFTTLATPLSSLLAIGQPGCDILVHPDVTSILLPAGGTVTSEILIPNTPSAAGFVLYHQLVPMELNGLFQFSAFTSTNALALTVGTY